MWFLRRQENKSGEEAKKALHEAKKALCEVQSRSDEVTKTAEALREIRERNHFAEQLEDLIRRKPLHP